MSICTCTPKQKDAGKPGRRCAAHHGHTPMPKKVSTRPPTKKVLSREDKAWTLGYAAALASVYRFCGLVRDVAMADGLYLNDFKEVGVEDFDMRQLKLTSLRASRIIALRATRFAEKLKRAEEIRKLAVLKPETSKPRKRR